MRRYAIVFSLALLFTVCFANAAFAGILGKVKIWLTGEVTAIIFSAVLALLAGAFSLAFAKVSRTFKELGEFLMTIAAAVEDKRITREELSNILSEGQDVLKAWR